MVKRQRSEAPSWWGEIAKDVIENGGLVHPSLEFANSTRTLSVNKRISEQTLILRIPRANLVSISNATKMAPFVQAVEASLDKSNLCNPVADILLAFTLASHRHMPYLRTLPPASAWDSLPRRWSTDQVTKLLEGSPLVSRVKMDKLGVRSDYDQLCECWGGQEKPQFSDFDDMLAAVTSRGFADSTDEVVMIPLLDLCDHSRGKGEGKNLAYESLHDGSVEVKTTQVIEAYERLRLTYGAQGNGQLLLNYGFAISKNLEPDGSSNDFLEFTCDGVDIIKLKTGPKAYTYGLFVKALEQALETKPDSISLQTNEDDGLGAFLNECDGGGPNDIDIYSEVEEGEPADGENPNKEMQLQVESIKQLKNALLKRINGYGHTGQDLRHRLEQLHESLDYFSALLLQSEQRCLYFFFRAAQKVESLILGGTFSTLELPTMFDDLPLDKDDLALIEQQTDELSKAYMKIRHLDFLDS